MQHCGGQEYLTPDRACSFPPVDSPFAIRHSRFHSAWLAAGFLFLLTVVLGLLSEGACHDDDVTHFQMARWARWFPEYLLHFWGRPGFTAPMAAVAWIGDSSSGWHAARLLSAVVTALSALIAAGLAGRLGVRPPWLVVVACYVQPFNTLLACTTLTENFAALYLILAVAALYRGCPVLSSLAFSLVLVTRHEMAVLWPIWVIAVWAVSSGWTRRLGAIAASIWAPLLHNLLFGLFLGEWPISMFFLPRGSTEFTPTGVFSYVPQAMLAVPPIIAALAIIGIVVMLGRGRWLIPALIAAYFLTHAASKALGLFASGGYARFMVAVAPLVAVSAVAGLGEMIDRVRQGRNLAWPWLIHAGVWLFGLVALEVEVAAGRMVLPGLFSLPVIRICVALFVLIIAMGWAVTAAWPNMRPEMRLSLGGAVLELLLLTCLLQCYQVIKPLKLNDEARQIRQVLSWLKSQDLAREPIFATQPWVAYFEDWVEMPRVHKGPALLAFMPAGTVVIWDSVYSPSDFHRLPLRHIASDPAYEELRRFRCGSGRQMKVRVYRKIAPTRPPSNPDDPYPPNLMDGGRPATSTYYILPAQTNPDQPEAQVGVRQDNPGTLAWASGW